MKPKRVTGQPKRRPKKGTLIQGMYKRLPSDILEDSIFQERLKEIMRGYAGIYALYRNNYVYYVGLTTNLFNRIRWHLRDRHAGKWDSFVIFRIKRVDYLRDIETLITRLVNIPGNRVKGRVPRNADLNRLLQDILSEHKKRVKKIEKALKG